MEIVDLSAKLQEGDDADPDPPRALPSRLAKVFPSMRRLEKAALILPIDHTDLFRDAFEQASVVLPSIRTLVLGPNVDWIVSMCPNVSAISTSDWDWLYAWMSEDGKRNPSRDLITAAGSAQKLQLFEMKAGDLKKLEAIHDALPNLQKLALTLRLEPSLKACLPILSKFSNLEVLTLAAAHELNVGFYPPDCGNAYLGPNGQARLQRDRTECRKAEERVALMAFKSCTRLNVLWIGDRTRATVVRDTSGAVRETTVERIVRTALGIGRREGHRDD